MARQFRGDRKGSKPSMTRTQASACQKLSLFMGPTPAAIGVQARRYWLQRRYPTRAWP